MVSGADQVGGVNVTKSMTLVDQGFPVFDPEFLDGGIRSGPPT
jgi:hypothetical protein